MQILNVKILKLISKAPGRFRTPCSTHAPLAECRYQIHPYFRLAKMPASSNGQA